METQTDFPYDQPEHTEELAPGVTLIRTPDYEGLQLSPERWNRIPDPVKSCLTWPNFAELHKEAPIILSLLNLADDCREHAIGITGAYPEYEPALPYLENPR